MQTYGRRSVLNRREPPGKVSREPLVPNAGWVIAGDGSSGDEEGMAAIDPELERHRQTWLGFTRLIKYAVAVIVIILIGMAIFLL